VYRTPAAVASPHTAEILAAPFGTDHGVPAAEIDCALNTEIAGVMMPSP
jgi:hypothetical protein